MSLQSKIKFFKQEVKRYIDLFGLYDWELYFDKEKSPDCRASCIVDSNPQGEASRIVTICYDEDWLKEENDLKQISKTAYHEVNELLLSKLREFSTNREIYVSHREVDDEVHRIIRIFENRIFDKIYEKV